MVRFGWRACCGGEFRSLAAFLGGKETTIVSEGGGKTNSAEGRPGFSLR